MSDADDYWGGVEETRKDEDAAEAERRKEEVGMAESGTEEYYRNAKYILKAYTHPNETTRQKLRDLEEMGY
jgi:hypothetical protein